jgi:hypothetical protein
MGTLLRRALLALGVYPEIRTPEKKTPEQRVFLLTGQDLTLCPICQRGTMVLVLEIPPLRRRTTALTLLPPLPDSS